MKIARRVLIIAADEAAPRQLRAGLEALGVTAAHLTMPREAWSYLSLWRTDAIVVAADLAEQVREMLSGQAGGPNLIVMEPASGGPGVWDPQHVLRMLDAVP